MLRFPVRALEANKNYAVEITNERYLQWNLLFFEVMCSKVD